MTEPAESPGREALDRARAHFDVMQKSTTQKQLAEAWLQYLQAIRRCWNKTEIYHMRDDRWRNRLRAKYAKQLLSDELPRYLWHARNADEHGISTITRERGQSVSFGGSGRIYEIKIENGRVEKFRGDPTIEVWLHGASVLATAVVDRGVTYQPPNATSGEPHVFELAQLGLDYYERLLADVETALAPSQ